MGDKTGIEWTGSTWTAIRARHKVTGKVGWFCEHVSPGCKHCYAEGINLRLGSGVMFRHQDRDQVEIFLDEKMLLAPLKWKKPRRIFVCSMTDLFADFVTDAMIDRVFAVMALCPQHTFQVLTKRAARMRAYLAAPGVERRIYTLACEMTVAGGLDVVLIVSGCDESLAPQGQRIFLDAWPLPNVWLGVSVEDQKRADERIPLLLLQTPAAKRFLSVEPLLGAVDLRHVREQVGAESFVTFDALDHPDTLNRGICRQGLDWVIVGGESGKDARPMHPYWARSLRDQCQAAGVPFFYKQTGEWAPTSSVDVYCHGPEKNKREFPGSDGIALLSDGRIALRDFSVAEHAKRMRAGTALSSRAIEVDHSALADFKASIEQTQREKDNPLGLQWMYRVGRRAAGRLLDGREWSEFPA